MHNHFVRLSGLLFCFLLLNAPLNADNGLQYNYGGLNYVADAELDAYNVDGDGFSLAGSLRIDELFYMRADYETLSFDRGIDTDTLSLSGGLIYPIRRFDTVSELALINRDIDGPNGDTNTGFRLGFGVRTYVLKSLELRAMMNYIDVDEHDSYATIAADYFVSPDFSLNIAKDLAADTDRLSIGVRYYFGY